VGGDLQDLSGRQVFQVGGCRDVGMDKTRREGKRRYSYWTIPRRCQQLNKRSTVTKQAGKVDAIAERAFHPMDNSRVSREYSTFNVLLVWIR
jgi:hypothetical protein